MKLFSLAQRFCQAVPTPSMFSFYDVVRPASLSQNELKHLYTFQSYQHCIRSFNSNRLLDSLNYATLAQKQLQESSPQEVNLYGFLLNVSSLIYKMLQDNTHMSTTLEKLFLVHSSYFGFNHEGSFKHFQNYFLSLLYSKKERAYGVLKYINEQDLPHDWTNRLKLLQSILYSLNEKNEKSALQSIQQFKPQTKEDEIMMQNNFAWIQLWNKRKLEKKDFEIAEQKIIKAIQIAEIEDVGNYMKQRSSSQQLALKYLLEKRDITTKNMKPLKLIHKQSHILSMNLGEVLYLSNKEEQASMWLQLSSKAGVDFQQFIRVSRALVYTARIFINNGMPDQAESMFLGLLKHSSEIQTHSLKLILANYTALLQKTQRYYEAEQYLNQIGNLGSTEEQDRLDRLLVPDYNFSY